MRLTIVFSLTIFFLNICKAQNTNAEYDKEFSFQVKQIDEFIKRFNFDTLGQNILKEYLDKNNFSNRDTFNRKFFIKSLFNFTGNFESDQLNEFISFVDSANNQVFLDFYDDNWYAFLDCDFSFLEKSQKVIIVLKNQVSEKKSSKWVINSVKSELFLSQRASDSSKIMNPMSHAVDFMTMNKCLADKKNLSNYFIKNFDPDAVSEFYFLVENNILKFQKINYINFYFFQIPHWFFKVENFERQGYNSGWLISQIQKMDADEKKEYLKQNLNLY